MTSSGTIKPKLEILESSSDRLAFSTKIRRSWLILFFILDALIFSVGAFHWTFPSRTRITCQRIEPTLVNCQTSQVGWIPLFSTSSKTLTNVESAYIKRETRSNDDGTYTVSQVWLKTSRGDIPINDYQQDQIVPFSTETPDNQLVNQLNLFLKATDTVNFEHNSRGFNVLFWGNSFVLIGGGLLVNLIFIQEYVILWRFDKSCGKLERIGKKLFANSSIDYALDEIKEIFIDIESNQMFRATVIFDNQKETQIINCNSNPWMFIPIAPPEEVEKLVVKISDFLNIPYELVCDNLTINNTSKQFTYTLPSGTKKIHNFADIEEITVQWENCKEGKDDGKTIYEYTYRVDLILKTKEAIFLRKFQSEESEETDKSNAKKQAKVLAGYLRHYLGLAE